MPRPAHVAAGVQHRDALRIELFSGSFANSVRPNLRATSSDKSVMTLPLQSVIYDWPKCCRGQSSRSVP